MARSLFLIIPIIPVKNEDTARIPVISIVIASAGLLKNVSPPLCPAAIREYKAIAHRRKNINSLTDQLPKKVLGL
jgi:hypothetical protein